VPGATAKWLLRNMQLIQSCNFHP